MMLRKKLIGRTDNNSDAPLRVSTQQNAV